MSTTNATRPAPPATVAARRVAFRYSDNVATVLTVELGSTGQLLEIVGDPDNAAYAWVLTRDGQVEAHSDDAYGCPDIALRDGLIAAHGLPSSSLVRDLADQLDRMALMVRSTALLGDRNCDVEKANAAAAAADALIARARAAS